MTVRYNNYYNWAAEFKSLMKRDYLSPDGMSEMVHLYIISDNESDKDKYRDIIVLNNVRLVMNIANRYCKKYNTTIEDTFQNGVFGLLTALDKFKEEQGVRFSTYASYWVEQNIQRAVNIDHPIQVSNAYRHMVSKYLKFKKACNGDNKKLRKMLKDNKVLLSLSSLENIAVILYNDKFFVGIEEEISVGGEVRSLKETIRDKKTDDPEEIFFEQWQREKLIDVIKKRLNSQEQRVIIGRYLSDAMETQEELGKALSVKRERVRQIEVKAIRKLKKIFSKPYTDIGKFFKKNVTKPEETVYNKPVKKNIK